MRVALQSPVAVLLLAWSAAFIAKAAEPAPADTRTERLLLHLNAQAGSEPLGVLRAQDLKLLPGAFQRTLLNEMLQDPKYETGRAKLIAMLNQWVGADVPALWPDFSRQCSGPAVLALYPGRGGDPAAPPFQLLFGVLVPDDASAQRAQELWPQAAPQSTALVAAARLNLLTADRLPALPPDAPAPPAEALVLDLKPRELGAMLRRWVDGGGESEGLDQLLRLVVELRDPEMQHLRLAIQPSGETFDETLSFTSALEPGESPLSRIGALFRDKPQPFDSLRAATPNGQTLVLLMQLDPRNFGGDGVYFGQWLERELRENRWMRGDGRSEEALKPGRYDRLLARWRGDVILTAHPSTSEKIRTLAVFGLRDTGNSPEYRDALQQELAAFGAPFRELRRARPLGDTYPWGAEFKGSSPFESPVIGMSPGWCWLFSSLQNYQEFCRKLETGAMLSATPEDLTQFPWTQRDALRLNFDLQTVINTAYMSWLLSAPKGLEIGAVKVPSELLPQPSIFTNRIRRVQSSLSREGRTVTIRSRASFPFSSGLVLTGLLEAAHGLERARYDSTKLQNAIETLKKLDALGDADPAAPGASTAPKPPDAPRDTPPERRKN